MTPEKEYEQAVKEWKEAIDKIIDTATITRKTLGMAADNIDLYISNLKYFERRMMRQSKEHESSY